MQSYNRIGAEGGKALGEALKVNTSVEKLDLVSVFLLFLLDFVKICDFYAGNAVQFSIRSDPFFEPFLRNSLSKMDMRACGAIAYAYTVVLVSNFVPKSRFSSRNAVRF